MPPALQWDGWKPPFKVLCHVQVDGSCNLREAFSFVHRYGKGVSYARRLSGAQVSVHLIVPLREVTPGAKRGQVALVSLRHRVHKFFQCCQKVSYLQSILETCVSLDLFPPQGSM